MLDKIFCTLYQNKSLILKMHVKLNNENDGRVETFHQIFSYGDKKYLKLELNSFLTLEFKEKDTDWNKDKTILITERNIYQIVKGFKEVIDNIYNNGIFAINNNNEVISYIDAVEKNTVKLFYLGGSQRLVLTPCVIYDFDGLSYEGCVLTINKNANAVQLTIDELESLYYTLSKIDLFTYPTMLLNYYMNSIGKVDNKSTKTYTSNIEKTRTVFDSVESRLKPQVSDEKYFDI